MCSDRAVEEPGICDIGWVTVFEVLLCQHLAALIVIFAACNYDVNLRDLKYTVKKKNIFHISVMWCSRVAH